MYIPPYRLSSLDSSVFSVKQILVVLIKNRFILPKFNLQTIKFEQTILFSFKKDSNPFFIVCDYCNKIYYILPDAGDGSGFPRESELYQACDNPETDLLLLNCRSNNKPRLYCSVCFSKESHHEKIYLPPAAIPPAR